MRHLDVRRLERQGGVEQAVAVDVGHRQPPIIAVHGDRAVLLDLRRRRLGARPALDRCRRRGMRHGLARIGLDHRGREPPGRLPDSRRPAFQRAHRIRKQRAPIRQSPHRLGAGGHRVLESPRTRDRRTRGSRPRCQRSGTNRPCAHRTHAHRSTADRAPADRTRTQRAGSHGARPDRARPQRRGVDGSRAQRPRSGTARVAGPRSAAVPVGVHLLHVGADVGHNPVSGPVEVGIPHCVVDISVAVEIQPQRVRGTGSQGEVGLALPLRRLTDAISEEVIHAPNRVAARPSGTAPIPDLWNAKKLSTVAPELLTRGAKAASGGTQRRQLSEQARRRESPASPGRRPGPGDRVGMPASPSR